MLGPALSHLLATLEGRTDNELTPFEQALLTELRAAKQLAPPLAKVLELSRNAKLGAALRGASDSEFDASIKEFNRIGASVDLRTQVGLGGGGWTGDDRMQTACGATNCPNKKKK